MTAGCQNDEACVEGRIECWSPGGLCRKPNDPACDLCGDCLDCASRDAAPVPDCWPVDNPPDDAA